MIQSSDGSSVEVMFRLLQHPFRQLPLGKPPPVLCHTQFFLPNSKIGITQLSSTDLDERGLISPWNTPMLP